MSRTLAAGFLIIVALVNATIAQTQTVAKPAGIGEAAPDFTLVDHHGTKVTLSDSSRSSVDGTKTHDGGRVALALS